jgi:hypothetical protein
MKLRVIWIFFIHDCFKDFNKEDTFVKIINMNIQKLKRHISDFYYCIIKFKRLDIKILLFEISFVINSRILLKVLFLYNNILEII